MTSCHAKCVSGPTFYLFAYLPSNLTCVTCVRFCRNSAGSSTSLAAPQCSCTAIHPPGKDWVRIWEGVSFSGWSVRHREEECRQVLFEQLELDHGVQVVGDTVPEFRAHYSEGGVIAGLVGRRALTADGRDDSFGSCARPCLEHDVEVVAGLTV